MQPPLHWKTGDLENRLRKYNTGNVRSTKPYRPWKLVISEAFADKTSARKREIFLKRMAKAWREMFDKI